MRLLLALSFLALGSVVWADEHEEDEGSGSLIGVLLEAGLSNAEGVQDPSEFADILVDMLENPETQSTLLNRYIESDPSWLFLRDVEFEFKVFDVEGDMDGGLGFSYNYDKSVADMELGCAGESCVRGLDFSFAATGNVAFDSDANPNDFLSTSGSFSFFQSVGGSPVFRDEAEDDAVFAQLLELEEQFVFAETDEEEEEAVQGVIRLLRPRLSNQFYFELSGNAGLESDQRFATKQWTYGVYGIAEIKSWSTDSGLSRLNVFDYPFALLRTLSGYEDCGACFRPRGTSWPVLLVGLDRISPDDDDPRALAGDASDYNRLKVELSFRTPIARIGEDRIYGALNYRRYEELSPSAVVEAAELDNFDYYTITLGGQDGIYISYTDGRLPLDATDDKVYELGFRFHLGR